MEITFTEEIVFHETHETAPFVAPACVATEGTVPIGMVNRPAYLGNEWRGSVPELVAASPDGGAWRCLWRVAWRKPVP